MSELTEELIGLQAVCERFGIDDDDVLNRAADHITEIEEKLADAEEELESHLIALGLLESEVDNAD